MAFNTVKIKNHYNAFDQKAAVAALTPGHLIELTSAGKVQKHSSAGGIAEKWFALESELEGRGIGTAYAAAEAVSVWRAGPGDEVNAILADGENVSIGTKLESAGDGTLRAYTSGVRIAMALEALDLSASSGAESSGLQGAQRLRVVII